MTIKQHLILVCVLIIISFYGCKFQDTQGLIVLNKNNSVSMVNEDNLNPTENNHVFFKANGNDATWSIEISNKHIKFHSTIEGFETFNAPSGEPIRAADANIKMYRSSIESGHININISEENCALTADSTYKYKVVVGIKRGIDKAYSSFEGCGNYITEYRLHDIWVLEYLEGKKITAEDFSKEFPNLEINASKNTFMGFGGCNRYHGTLFSENTLLRFSKIATTMMMCPTADKENEFLKALQASTHYKIENKRLYLSNPSNEILVFKKVD